MVNEIWLVDPEEKQQKTCLFKFFADMEDLPEIFSNQGPEEFLRNPALVNNPFSKTNWNTLLEIHDLPYTRDRGGQGKNAGLIKYFIAFCYIGNM